MRFISRRRVPMKVQIHPVFMENAQKPSMYSSVKFYGKDNEQHEILIPVRLMGLKEDKRPL